MCTLPKFLMYLAQVAGAGVSGQNVVAFTLGVHKTAHKSEPWLFYANNEDVDIDVKVQTGDVVVTIGGWTSANLPAPVMHGSFDPQADAVAIGSQSKARLRKILAGNVELTEGAIMACAALRGGRIMKVGQPDGFKAALNGYGFIHAEMLLLDFLVGRGLASPSEKGGIWLGVSKRLCAYCATAVSIYEQSTGTELFVPEAHWLAYFRWRPPAVLLPYLNAIIDSLNRSSKMGPVFSLRQQGEMPYIENRSTYDGHRCNQNVIIKFALQHGGSSPYRESRDEAPPEVVWICPNSGCPINYGKRVVPVDSGGMMSRRVCPVCVREVVQLNQYG